MVCISYIVSGTWDRVKHLNSGLFLAIDRSKQSKLVEPHFSFPPPQSALNPPSTILQEMSKEVGTAEQGCQSSRGADAGKQEKQGIQGDLGRNQDVSLQELPFVVVGIIPSSSEH